MTPGASESDQDRTVIAGPHGGPTLGPGTKILNDTYIIERCLGKGGMGEVYEAEHIELGSKRAIKIILPEYARNTQYVALFIEVGSSRVDLQACKLEYSIVSPK